MIQARATAVVDAVVRDEVGFPRWIKQLVAATITEYRGRFLHELIQHSASTLTLRTLEMVVSRSIAMRTSVHMVSSRPVAGRSQGQTSFGWHRLETASNTHRGVGMGNKGVGFKGVFQVCDAPEVFSATEVD